MKYYTSIGPNPRVVSLFMAARGIQPEIVKVDLRGGENRGEAFMRINPTGTLPALALDDGTVIAEVTAICEYLDEVTPGASLIGSTALERAETRMWTRRIDLTIAEPLTNGYRFGEGLALFQSRLRCIPEASDGLKTIAREKTAWLDAQMTGRSWICGDRFTLADIFLFAFLEFGTKIGQPFDTGLAWIPGWYERVAARFAK
ncbi:MAG: glutathione S-transferase family protein [Acetobacteraceae bacterium]|nr:glutathione S-transferase family protein [Acetobacteraceae bacterium]